MPEPVTQIPDRPELSPGMGLHAGLLGVWKNNQQQKWAKNITKK
jgi:hypothetical protein